MGQQLELINHRNKIMLQLFAVIWVVIALLNAATDPMLLIDFLVMGLVLFGTLGFLVRKRKFIKGTMYLITLIIYSMSAVSILGTPVMGNLIIVLFWQVFFSLYQNTTLTVTNGVVTISLFSYAFWGMSGAIPGFTAVEYSMLMITSVFTTLVLIVISRTTSRLLRNTEQSRVEAEHAKHRAEEVLRETQTAISALTAFSNKLNQTVAHTHVSSSEVASAMSEMAGAVETQSRSVGGINERMRQVGRFVHDVASSSDSMRDASTQTMSVIEHSSSEVAHLNTQMLLAQEHAAKTARLVNELNQKSEQISAIILVISNIARQTNMLALNASIEAARAGEHGRGFTVVAEEIRKLADHSHQSVGEVIAILDEIKSKSSEATTQVDLSETTFSHINEITGNVTSGYANIIENTKDVVRKATDSGELIRHLQSNLDTITTDIHLVAALSDENTSSIESILAAIEEQSRTIQQIVENFRDLQEQSQGLQNLMDQH